MTPTEETMLFRKVSWRILPLVMLGFLFSYTNRINVGFAKLQMVSDLHFSDAVYGVGAGIFFIGYFIFEIPSNVLLHRFGARRWIARIMVTWGALSAATALVHTEWQFYGMRLLLGIAEAGFLPGVIYYMSQWYPAARRGRAWSVFYIALASSGLFGSLVSGSILSTLSGAGGIAGWQWLMLLEGLPTVMLGIYVFFRMADRAQDVDWLSDAEKQHLSVLLATETRGKLTVRIRDLFASGKIWTLAFIYFAYNVAVYSMSFWLPSMIQGMGVHDAFRIGELSALPNACAVVSMLIVGYSSDRLGDRRWHLFGSFIVAALGFTLSYHWQHEAAWSISALCLANMALLSIPALFWTLPTAMLFGVAAAAGIGMINSLGNLSGLVAPIMFGYLKGVTGNINNGLLALSLLLVCGAVMVIRITRGTDARPVVSPEHEHRPVS
jgi:MFS family permease